MKPKTLKVFSVAGKRVTRVDHDFNGVREYIGYRQLHVESLLNKQAGVEFVHPNELVHSVEWIQDGSPVELPYHKDYVVALKEGDLLPADEATAKAAMLKFGVS